MECDPLDPLINGQIELFPTRGLNNNSFNSVARHICSEGFMIFGGDVTRTCGLDGRWTGTPPFCRGEKNKTKFIINRKRKKKWNEIAASYLNTSSRQTDLFVLVMRSYWLPITSAYFERCLQIGRQPYETRSHRSVHLFQRIRPTK